MGRSSKFSFEKPKQNGRDIQLAWVGEYQQILPKNYPEQTKNHSCDGDLFIMVDAQPPPACFSTPFEIHTSTSLTSTLSSLTLTNVVGVGGKICHENAVGIPKENYLVVSIPLKNISKIGSFPQVGVKIKIFETTT